MPATLPVHLTVLDLIALIIFSGGKNYEASLCDIFSSILLLYSSALSVYLRVTDQVSQPYNRKGKIIGMYILIFTFLDLGRKTEEKITAVVRREF